MTDLECTPGGTVSHRLVLPGDDSIKKALSSVEKALVTNDKSKEVHRHQ